ncbi:hypothetical protein BZA70DRAFT_137032 [Myxozyma melibiosi]|uniref:RRM domain-containing protein n=1 Tax=Myxozyma melibiosi TaxID=54550 RepID=A0ABR1F735_9ASCO
MSQEASSVSAQALPIPGTIRRAGVSSRTNKPVPPPPAPPPGRRAIGSSSNAIAIDSGLAAYGNPSQTLYINNLNDKIQKDELKLCLYTLFATYGTILDVVAVKTPKMRGQAHVVFASVPSATAALRSLQGFSFLGKEMHIAFAKSKSNVVARNDGTFNSSQALLQQTTAAAAAAVDEDVPMYAAPADDDDEDKEEEEVKQGTKRSRENDSDEE